MKTLTTISAIMLIVITGLLFTGCEKVPLDWQDGERMTRTFDYRDFTSVEVGYAFHLELIPSDDYSITITAGEKVFEHLEVTKSGDKLVIEVTGWWINIHRSPEVVIEMPVLEGIKLTGASRGVANGFSGGERFEAEVSGASNLQADVATTGPCRLNISGASRLNGSLSAGGTQMVVSGASEVNLQGSGGEGDLELSGASTGSLYDFVLSDTEIDISGASNGRLTVNGRLDADVSGASTLRYSGDTTLGSIDVSTGSSIGRR